MVVGMASMGTVGLPSPLFFLLSGNEMNCAAPPHTLAMICGLATVPKAMRPTDHRLAPPRLSQSET
jgi:hypothetical protein